MTTATRSIIKWILIVFAACTVIIFLAGSLLPYYITPKLEERLKSFGGKVRDLDINLFSRTITLDGIEFKISGDSTPTVPSTVQIEKIIFKNVSLYDAVVNKKISINEVFIGDGNILINQQVSFSDSASAPSQNPLKEIAIDRLVLENLKINVVSDSIPNYSGTVNLNLYKIKSSDTGSVSNIKGYTLDNLEAKLSDLILHDAAGLYKTEISTIQINSQSQKIQLDSLLIIPRHTKYKFAKVAGKQTDRISAFIRKINITGLLFNSIRDSAFVASNIHVDGAEISSFRDKRLPFKETENKPLPMALLKSLDFSLEVDTVEIKNSTLSYEEFPTEGFKSGKIIFEDLNATLTNLSNRIYQNKPNHATLNATAKLMGKGLIQASFTLPMDEKPYHAEGKISTMALHHLNPALENLAFISIESGKLKEVNFNFDYNDDVSNGKLIINYQDLKINGLKKERGSVVNDLKTLLINTVVKNDKDKSVSLEKRTGTINFERDKKRQIFNYWWKSMFSGIKGSVL